MLAPAHGSCQALAEAFSYPAPGRLERLQRGLAALPEGEIRKHFAKFVAAIARLSPGEWEELHTRTLDLDPLVAPYVGYYAWGESYRRGGFLGRLNRALAEAGVDKGGELPDYLGTVLRYLAVSPEPLPELAETLGPALDRMVTTLQSAHARNPYVELFLAVRELWAGAQEKEAA